jgi:hypothetical protein
MNPFRAHTQYVQAQDAARQGGSNASLTGYNQMLLQLTEHRRRLKTVQSNERKAQLKREFLPAYASWIAGLLDADASGQDDVAMYVMIWRIDAGDYTGALDIARHAIKHGWVLPQRFNRTCGTAVAEEFADAAMRAFLPVNHSVPPFLPRCSISLKVRICRISPAPDFIRRWATRCGITIRQWRHLTI